MYFPLFKPQDGKNPLLRRRRFLQRFPENASSSLPFVPYFVILDEPTAALDPLSEYDIYTKFNDIIGTRTAIYISHRLSSCRFCDNITVLDNGEIAEQGSHKELLKEKGVYFTLWSEQAKYYLDTAGSLYM